MNNPEGIRAQGPGQATPSVAASFLDIGAKQGFSAQLGSLVSLTVIEDLGDGQYRVRVGGQLYTAKSELALEAGSLLSARVEERGSRLLLKIVESSKSLTNLVSELGLKNDESSLAVVSAFLGAGLKLDPIRLKSLRTGISSLNADKETAADILAELERRGLLADAGALDDITQFIGASSQDSGGEKEKRKKDQGDSEKKDDSVEGEIPDIGENQAVLVLPANDSQDSIFQLINHVETGEDRWLYLPYRFQLENVEYKGIFKLLLHSPENKLACFVVEAYSERGRSVFSLRPGEALVKLAEAEEGLAHTADELAAFEKILAEIGYSLQVDNRDSGEYSALRRVDIEV